MALIPKPGKDMTLSSSFRPVCLLAVAGKILETLLTQRLDAELEKKGAISPRQQRFMKRRSTVTAMSELKEEIQACNRKWMAVVTMDVKNAFNTVWWPRIVEKMRRVEISS